MSAAGYRTKNDIAEAAKRADANRRSVGLLKTQAKWAQTSEQREAARLELRRLGVDPLAKGRA